MLTIEEYKASRERAGVSFVSEKELEEAYKRHIWTEKNYSESICDLNDVIENLKKASQKNYNSVHYSIKNVQGGISYMGNDLDLNNMRYIESVNELYIPTLGGTGGALELGLSGKIKIKKIIGFEPDYPNGINYQYKKGNLIFGLLLL